MEENEDEPEDVRNVTPVAGDVESGTKDEKAEKQKARSKNKDGSKPSRCDKDKKKTSLAKSEADCCRSRIPKPSKTPKTMSVLVYSPPCTLPRLEIIPRHCLSKQEYIDVLAAPSRKCPPACLGKTVIRKARAISARNNELAQPARRLIVGTLQERGETLPPEMISNLVKSIEGSACLSPEQAEQYFRDKERGKGRKHVKISSLKKCKEKLKNPCSSQLDKDAVMCQYLMAERFVKSILQWKCPIPVEEFRDIAVVISRRLSFVLEYTPIDGQEDIKSQQMRFLADIIACWISGVLFEVAEDHREEIKEEQIGGEEEDEEEEDEEEEEEPEKPINEPDEDEEEEEKEEEEQQQQQEEKTENEEPLLIDAKEEKTENEEDLGKENENLSENPVAVKPEPQDANDLADELKATKEAEEEEKARLEAEKKKREEEEEEEKARLEAEKKKKAMEEEEAKLKAEQEEERKKKQAEEEEEEDRKKKETEEKKKIEEQEEEEEEKKKKKQKEEEEEAAAEEERRKKEAEEKKKKEEEEAEEKRKKEEEEAEEKRKKEEEEAEEKRKKEQEEAEEKRKKEESESEKKKEEDKLKEIGLQNAIDSIGDGDLFKTDLPFVTFGKIVDTFYNMLEDEPEGDETEIIHNRIQRAIYDKFARLISLETPDALTENLKDVIDVLSGKAATWVKRLLRDSEVKFISDHPPEVESKEIRDWGKWIDQVTDRASDWADWIHRVVKNAETKSKGDKINRGDWQSWTSDTDTNALLWRRYYLETIHQAHHNKMMVADRPVVKTGNKGLYSSAEEEIKNTDLVG